MKKKMFAWNACLIQPDCIITEILMYLFIGLPVWTCPTSGAPSLLWCRHVCAERIRKYGAAHLCPLQPSEWAHTFSTFKHWS